MIKNLNKALIMLVAVVIAAVCAFFAAPVYSFAASSASINSTEIEEILHDFIEQNENRYGFNSDNKGGEKRAAEYLMQQLEGYGYSDSEIEMQEFSAEFETSSASFFQSAKTETRYSQNVVCSLKSSVSAQKIVVGCFYDNDYKDSASTGALRSGSGVAVCLALCKQLQNQQNLPFNIDIVFFGAGAYDFKGSVAYISRNGLKNVAAMLNVSRIGGGSTYIYCDETKTPLEDYLLAKGGQKMKMPQSVPVLNVEFVTGYPYTHYGMLGNHSAFMGNGVKTANIFGGYYSSLALSDLEGKSDILSKDTVKSMEREYPDCYNKMEKAANIILQSVTDSGFASAFKGASARDSVLLKRWVAYIIFAAITAAALFVFYFIGRRLLKKYPPVLKKGRIAVFGAEYETLKDNEVLIDIKPATTRPRHPFDDL